MTTSIRLVRGLLLLPGLLLFTPAAAQEPAQIVNVVQLDGAVDAAFAGYLTGQLAHSAREGHVAVVLRLASSGTIKVNAGALARSVCESKVPVLAWVGPNDAAVAGGATLLWLAADVRLVGPDAEVRSIRPLQPGGAVSDVVPLSTPCLPSTAGSLLDVGARLDADALVRNGLAQAKAGTIAEAIRHLERAPSIGVDPDAATIRFANPGLIARIRHALATNPTLVYLLLIAGIGAIVFEAFQPGFGPAGYAGVLLVALAAYGLVALPTNPVGLALLLLGTGAMALDVRRNSLGALTWGGAIGLTAGSWWLFHSHGPALRVAWPAIALGVLGSLLFYVVVMTVVLRALRGQSAEMGQALLGRIGEVRSPLNPQGHVLVEGALWRARAIEWDGAVPAGTRVTVTGVDSEALVLDVQPVET